MHKSSNPWIEALNSRTNPLDLAPEVMRAVLAMNPAMRRGRTTGQVTADLQALATKPQPTRAYSEGKFRNVFGSMLNDLEQQLQQEGATFAERRAQLAREEAEFRSELVQRIVRFLVEVQPGPVSDASRAVMREHSGLLHQLGVELPYVARLVREQSDTFSLSA